MRSASRARPSSARPACVRRFAQAVLQRLDLAILLADVLERLFEQVLERLVLLLELGPPRAAPLRSAASRSASSRSFCWSDARSLSSSRIASACERSAGSTVAQPRRARPRARPRSSARGRAASSRADDGRRRAAPRWPRDWRAGSKNKPWSRTAP